MPIDRRWLSSPLSGEYPAQIKASSHGTHPAQVKASSHGMHPAQINASSHGTYPAQVKAILPWNASHPNQSRLPTSWSEEEDHRCFRSTTVQEQKLTSPTISTEKEESFQKRPVMPGKCCCQPVHPCLYSGVSEQSSQHRHPRWNFLALLPCTYLLGYITGGETVSILASKKNPINIPCFSPGKSGAARPANSSTGASQSGNGHTGRSSAMAPLPKALDCAS